jgi:hypothetical protein
MSEHDDVLAIIGQKNQAPFAFTPERAALLVIDVQRYFVRPDHAFGQVFERLGPGVTRGYFARVRETVVPNIGPESQIAHLALMDRLRSFDPELAVFCFRGERFELGPLTKDIRFLKERAAMRSFQLHMSALQARSGR